MKEQTSQHDYLSTNENSGMEIFWYYTVSGTLDSTYESWLSRTNSLPSTYSIVNFVVYLPEIDMVETLDYPFLSLLRNHIRRLYQVIQNRAKLWHWELIKKVLESSPYQALLEAEEKVSDMGINTFLYQIEADVSERYKRSGKVRIPFRPTQHCSEMGILEYPIYQPASRSAPEPFGSKCSCVAVDVCQ